MEAFDAILKRRSIRHFTQKPVSKEHIRKLLEAAMAAPSAHDSQPWMFIVVQDPATKERLSKVHPWTGMCAEAAGVIVVCGDKDDRKWIEACSAATENILIAAIDLGLGTVWCDVRSSSYGGFDDEQAVRDILCIPSKFSVLCMIAFGYPAEDKPAKTQYKEEKVFYERYGSKRP